MACVPYYVTLPPRVPYYVTLPPRVYDRVTLPPRVPSYATLPTMQSPYNVEYYPIYLIEYLKYSQLRMY